MKAVILFALMLMSSSLLAGVCQVEVTYHYKTGHTEKKVYDLKSPTKEACEKKRSLYEVNTVPKKLNSKEVKIKWLG